jgi:hypothetical protein
MILLAAFLLPAWLGLALVGAAGWFQRDQTASGRLFGFVVALPLGLAASSAVAFFWLAVLRPWVSVAGEILIELAVAVTATVVWWRRQHGMPPEDISPAGTASSSVLLTGLGFIALAIGLGRLAWGWLHTTFRMPLGYWDALAIWNLKARFLFHPEGWRRAFSPEIDWSHPDYPLLLPSFVARTWTWIGEPAWIVPALTELVFIVLGVLLLATALHRLRGLVPALAGAVLATGVAYLFLRFNQYADMPLAVYFLATNVLLLEGSRHRGSGGFVCLAGVSAGAMVWIKNEGWALLAAAIASEAVVMWAARIPLRQIRQQATAFAAGLLPLAGTTLVFKLALAPANDIVAGATWGRLFETSRWAEVLGALWNLLFSFGPFLLPLLPLLLAYVLIQGLAVPKTMRVAFASLALRLGLALAAYCLAFLLTPYVLAWHLSTALERLVSQLVPSVILLTLAAARPPGACSDPETPAMVGMKAAPCDSAGP